MAGAVLLRQRVAVRRVVCRSARISLGINRARHEIPGWVPCERCRRIREWTRPERGRIRDRFDVAETVVGGRQYLPIRLSHTGGSAGERRTAVRDECLVAERVADTVRRT